MDLSEIRKTWNAGYRVDFSTEMELVDEVEKLQQENTRLRSALEVYAKEDSWNNEKLTEPDGCVWVRSSWMGDDAYGHTVARQALATEGSTENALQADE